MRYPQFDISNTDECLDVKDWVKISEMFLGKVPDSFSFVPKHKSATYKEDATGSVVDGTAEVEG